MSFNDPISELLTKIRNAQAAKHKFVDAWQSKIKLSVIKILKDKGFIENYLVNEKKRKIRIFLKYSKSRAGIIRKLERVSRPGRRKYVTKDQMPYILGGIGTAIISTSQGVIDDETARKLHIGGEVLCNIW